MNPSSSVTEEAALVIFSSSRGEPSASPVVPSSSLAENTFYLHYYGPGVIPTQTASTALFLPEQITSPPPYSSVKLPSVESTTSIESNTGPTPSLVERASDSEASDASMTPTSSILTPEGSASPAVSIVQPSSEFDGDNEVISISDKASNSSEYSEDTSSSSGTESSFYDDLISLSSETDNLMIPLASDRATILAQEYWNEISDGMTIAQIFGQDD